MLARAPIVFPATPRTLVRSFFSHPSSLIHLTLHSGSPRAQFGAQLVSRVEALSRDSTRQGTNKTGRVPPPLVQHADRLHTQGYNPSVPSRRYPLEVSRVYGIVQPIIVAQRHKQLRLAALSVSPLSRPHDRYFCTLVNKRPHTLAAPCLPAELGSGLNNNSPIGQFLFLFRTLAQTENGTASNSGTGMSGKARSSI